MGNTLCYTPLVQDEFEFRELGRSWSSQIDKLAIYIGAFSKAMPAFFGLSTSFLFALFIYCTDVNNNDVSQMPSVQRLGIWDESNSSSYPRHAEAFDNFEWVTRDGIFPEINMLEGEIPKNSTVRLQYARLATAYLTPFRENGIGKIARHLYMEPFLNKSNVCSGCFLIQVKKKQVYIYDPKGVRSTMAEFREIRMREAVYWVISAVRRGIVDDTELIVSTTDDVATTSREHNYRMSPIDIPRPIFGIIGCNVSDNIPFPMMLTDVLRRAETDRFWNRRSDVLKEWDATMHNSSLNSKQYKWHNKISKAVFRGSLRISAYLKDKNLFDESCDDVGRSGLWKIAQRHMKDVAGRNWQKMWRGALFKWPFSPVLPREEPLLDVQVEGPCGRKVYSSDHMPMSEQEKYKYSIHAEGNSFWADRIMLQLFRSQAIVKQNTPCGMFFEPLMRPFVHFIPVDFFFRHIVKQVQWARENDDQVVQIVENARKFAGEYLSVDSIQTYVDELLVQYTSLLEDRNIEIAYGAMRLYPQ